MVPLAARLMTDLLVGRMTEKAAAKMVGEMREAQKQYFKTRTQSALKVAKELEKEVDAWVKSVQP